MTEIKITEKTDEQYDKIFFQLAAKYLNETGVRWHESPISMCEWVISEARENQ